MRSRFAVALAAASVATFALAQGAPRGKVSASVGGKNVTVDFGRPALKGRSFDDLLKQLPPERIWRAGENQVSIFSTEGDLSVGGKVVKAGTYSLYVHLPATGDAALILNSDLGQPLSVLWKEAPENMKNAPFPYLGNYEQAIKSKEVLRAPMKASKPAAAVESLTVSFAPLQNGATMTLAWGDRAWSLDLTPAAK
jgi:hypothetical protein